MRIACSSQGGTCTSHLLLSLTGRLVVGHPIKEYIFFKHYDGVPIIERISPRVLKESGKQKEGTHNFLKNVNREPASGSGQAAPANISLSGVGSRAICWRFFFFFRKHYDLFPIQKTT